MDKIISVVIPCYNQAHFLGECLNSVYNQTYQHWECIIVNDGSTDNTESVAKFWLKKDKRFKYILKDNGGLSSARNAGLNTAKGEYIQFLDCDDTLHPLKFVMQLECFISNIDVVVSDYYPFDNDFGVFCSRRYLNPFLNLNNYKYDIVLLWETRLSIPCHCIIFKRRLLEYPDSLSFEESLPNHEDWVFWVKLFNRSSGIFNLRIALANYRIHSSSICQDEVLMKKGFALAADMLVQYFKNQQDTKGMQAAEMKKSFILPNTQTISIRNKSKLKKVILLLTPPVTLIFWSKLKNYMSRTNYNTM